MVILFIAVVFFIFGFVVISGDWFLFENILYLSEMRVLTEYEVAKILNKTEVEYVQKVKSGHDRSFNTNAIYAVREIRKKINKYLDIKYEN